MRICKITDNRATKHTWDIEVDEVHEYQLGNGCVSHNTSGKSVNATESIEPIQHMFYKEDGTISVPTLVPNFKQNNKYYKKAFECDQFKLVELAAIRQMYLDQGQSVNMYFPRPDSFDEIMSVHLYGFHLGMKTFYYVKQVKGSDDEECESCS